MRGWWNRWRIVGASLLALAIAWEVCFALVGGPGRWLLPWCSYWLATAASLLLCSGAWRAGPLLSSYVVCLALTGVSAALVMAWRAPDEPLLASAVQRAMIYMLLPLLWLVSRVPLR